MEDYGYPIFDKWNLDKLKLDQFYINIPKSYVLYYAFKDCVECPFRRSKTTKIGNINSLYQISKDNVTYLTETHQSCHLNYDFEEFGIYNVTADEEGCNVKQIREGVNAYLPIATVAAIYLVAATFLAIALYVYKVYTTKKNATSKPKKERISSIDTFRGISIAIMIFVNYGGGGYKVLEHATWNGLHLADFAFPWFMWIMGVCIPISLSGSFKRNVSNCDIMKNVLKRSIKLFLLGLYLGGGSTLETIRIFGVLQRFGLIYLIVTTICVFTMRRETTSKKVGILEDILRLWKGWVITLLLQVAYLLIIFFVNKPGCEKGYMGPGGIHQHGKNKDCIGGATGYLDELILGRHIYQEPTAKEVYESGPFDPEGIIGCLPTIFHVYLGVQAGTILLTYKAHQQRLTRWTIWGIITTLIGAGLCGFSRDDGIIPINKNLWSLSFVTVTSGLGFITLAICYVLIDLKKCWSGKPFLFAGMNAILMYIGHEMSGGHFPINWDSENYTRRTHFWCMIYDVWGASIWIVISYYLYKINYFFVI